MKKIDANKWLTVVVVVACTIVARSCAAQGLYDRDGTVSEGTSPGIQYFRTDDGNYGWQSTTNGVVYSHGSKRSCQTNSVLGTAHTSCHEW
jgi:hypothetical protein